MRNQLMTNTEKVFAWVGGVATCLTVIGSVFYAMVWGIPFYLESAVQTKFDALVIAQGTPTEVIILTTQMEGMETMLRDTRDDIQFLREKMMELLER